MEEMVAEPVFGDNEKANEEWLREEKAKRELNHPNCPNWEPPGSLDFWRGEGQNGEGIGWEQVFYGEKWGKWASEWWKAAGAARRCSRE